jgi:hypothetical protein
MALLPAADGCLRVTERTKVSRSARQIGKRMRTHDLRNRRLRYVTQSTGKHVTRRPSDLGILEALHRLGPQTTDALYQLLYPLYTNRRSLLYRLADLRNQENSDYGGPLLFYPDQQRRGATMPDNNHMVYDLLPRGEKLLKHSGLCREHHPTTNGHEWKHDFMVGTIIASIAIAIKADPAHYTFLYPDQVLEDLDGRRSFPVPEYGYVTQAGNQTTRRDALLRPDGLFAIKYPDGANRIFLLEADCRTEPYRSDNLERKSHKHTILSYHALMTANDIRREYFSDARVGVLNVFTHPRAMRSAMEVHEELLGNRGNFMLYQTWDAFGDYFRPLHRGQTSFCGRGIEWASHLSSFHNLKRRSRRSPARLLFLLFRSPQHEVRVPLCLCTDNGLDL